MFSSDLSVSETRSKASRHASVIPIVMDEECDDALAAHDETFFGDHLPLD